MLFRFVVAACLFVRMMRSTSTGLRRDGYGAQQHINKSKEGVKRLLPTRTEG